MSLLKSKLELKTYKAYDALLDNIINSAVDKSSDYLIKSFISYFSIEIKYDLYDSDWKQILAPLKIIDRHFKKSYVKKNSYINHKGERVLRAKTFYSIFFSNIKSFMTVWYELTEGEEYLHIYFWGKNPAELYKFYNDLSTRSNATTPTNTSRYIFSYTLYTNNDGDCYWKNKSLMPAKDWSKLFIEDTLKKRIINYLDSFKKAKPLFFYMEVTYKLGILLYGPPGTGKTSLAKIIASYIGTNLYIVNMGSFSSNVVEKINNTTDSNLTIFLLEDIDYIFGKRQNDRTPEEKANGNALLQLLDGANSSSNVVFIATTNDIDSLDPAIVREGRFDLKIHMDNISTPIAEEMVQSIGLKPIDVLDYSQEKHNPAQIQNKMVQYIFENIEDISSFIETKEDKNEKSNIDRCSPCP